VDHRQGVRVLNAAENRECKARGIGGRVEQLMRRVFACLGHAQALPGPTAG
jgi:hypothetical protein